MNESIKLFFHKYGQALICFVAIIWVLFFSLKTLTTKPRLWTDESISIELARNFSLYGKLDVAVRPGIFSGQSALLQSTGYPVTVPMALFFKIFGFGAAQARIYMIIWMVLLLLTLILFINKAFGYRFIAWPVLLIASFATFYANGRCATGEVPGFVFLLLGTYFLWYRERRIFLSGLFFGLAIVSKPSIYMLLLPALLISVLVEKSQPIKKLFSVGLGMVFPAIFWIILMMPNPFSKSAWAAIFSFYKNPFGSMSIHDNIAQNLPLLFQHPTLIYFFGLLAVIILSIYLNRDFYQKHKSFLNFVIIYYIFAMLYFLKSPGWLRYTAAGQLLILTVFPYALAMVIDRLNFIKESYKKIIIIFLLLFLVSFQLYHLVYHADIFYGDVPRAVAKFINDQPANLTVSVINLPIISSLIDPARKFQLIKLLGLPILGQNPLALNKEDLPDLIVNIKGGPDFKEYENVARENYYLFKSIEEYDIYKLRLLK